MKMVEKIYTDVKRVQFICLNRLRTFYVSHEETFEPDEFDGDFAEPITYIICNPIPDEYIAPGYLMENPTYPRAIVPKDSCLLLME